MAAAMLYADPYSPDLAAVLNLAVAAHITMTTTLSMAWNVVACRRRPACRCEGQR
jgi:hypothetical protein